MVANLMRAFVVAALSLSLIGPLHAQLYQGRQLVHPRLLAEADAVVPGKPFTVGLYMRIEPHWHTYWRYPGDAGMATRIEWNLPEEFSASAIQFPIPKRVIEPGYIVTYAYEDEVMLLVEITPPAKITASEITLEAKANWLVCEEICIPGDANLSLTLPVAAQAGSQNVELFSKYRKLLPKKTDLPFNVEWIPGSSRLVLKISGLPETETAEFFPLPAESVVVGHPEVRRGDIVEINLPVQSGSSSAIDGVLVESSGGERTGWLLTQPEPGAAAVRGAQESLAKFLLLGFIGGFILNLMPCVLPVIALKIFGFIKQAGESSAKIFRLGLAFVGGIFAWFLGLALLVVIFKMAGRDLMWAFQFQNPYFVLGMSAVISVFALNLFGVFEIFLPEKTGARVLDLARREGYAGAFFHGMFATLLATPCTAPFLAPALGFAFAQTPVVTVVMFSAIAAGMAFPYVILTLRPGWLQHLPRSGAWMGRVKQFMGFLLLGTVLWLLWVLGKQRGVDGAAWAGAFLLTLAIACWIKGAFVMPGATTKTRAFATVAMIAVVGAGFFYFIVFQFAGVRRAGDGIPWQPFSTQALAQGLAKSRTVFIDFTADWCWNCKWNERFVLEKKAVREAFEQHNVLPLKADWTNGDPEITAMLKKFGRVGVPAYVVYPAQNPDEPVLLPELLTREIVINAVSGPGTSLSSASTERGEPR